MNCTNFKKLCWDKNILSVYGDRVLSIWDNLLLVFKRFFFFSSTPSFQKKKNKKEGLLETPVVRTKSIWELFVTTNSLHIAFYEACCIFYDVLAVKSPSIQRLMNFLYSSLVDIVTCRKNCTNTTHRPKAFANFINERQQDVCLQFLRNSWNINFPQHFLTCLVFCLNSLLS